MQDNEIVDLYWSRCEDAITETDKKYGKLLGSVSLGLTHSRQDADECVNDTYLAAWNRMPSDRPEKLGAYLTKIVRALSIDKYRRTHAEKRGGVDSVTVELSDMLPSDFSVEGHLENERLKKALDDFIKDLPEQKRVIFIKRYFFCKDIDQISSEMKIGRSNIKTSLFRMRQKLYEVLKGEELL